jgi:hypothetical protein
MKSCESGRGSAESDPLQPATARVSAPSTVFHYHHERNHQGLRNELIDGDGGQVPRRRVRRRQRIGRLLSYDYPAA